MIRVLVADDQAVVREGFAALLDAQDDIVVVGEAANGEEAVALARRTRPDVVLLDVRMPVMDGLEATRQLLRGALRDDRVRAAASRPPMGGQLENRRIRVLILTTFDLDDYVFEALRAGASGFLLKDATAADLVAAVRVVAAGEALLAPSVTRKLIEEFAGRPGPDRAGADRLRGLTPREVEVLGLIARGLSNAEIAAQLVVSEETVKTHVGRVFAKLDVRDRAQAVVTAYETGLVVPGGRAR